MNFLKNANKIARDVGDLNDSLNKLGIETGLPGTKDARLYRDIYKHGKSLFSDKNTTSSATPTQYSEVNNPSPLSTPGSVSINVPATDETGPPVPVNNAEGSHTGKLPLAVRKSIRDNWEVHKAEKEQTLSKILDVPWTIFVDIPGVFSYAVHERYAQRNLGGTIDGYFEGANKCLADFVKKYGEDGKNEINSLAHRHFITLEPTFDKSIRYNSSAIVDGRLVILFKNDQLSINIDDPLKNIGDVVNKAGANSGDASGEASGGKISLSMHARQSIQKDYLDKVDGQLELARKYLQEPSFRFDPNFEANYAMLAAYENSFDPDDYNDRRNKLYGKWAERIGGITLLYFEKFNEELKRKGFNKDEMLQEGFNESIDNHCIKLVVQENIKKRYHEIEIENGILIIRTNPGNWGTNIHSACENIIDLL